MKCIKIFLRPITPFFPIIHTTKNGTFLAFSLLRSVECVVLTSPLVIDEVDIVEEDVLLEAVDPLELVFLSAGLAGCKVGLEYPMICNKDSAAERLANFLFGPLP